MRTGVTQPRANRLPGFSARAAAVVLGLALLFVAGSVSAARPLTEQLTTENFDIRYTKGDYLSADVVSRVAEESFGRISSDLGYDGPGARRGRRIPIDIYPNHRQFAEATGVRRGHFVVGRAHAIVEKIELDSQELFASLESVTAHEIAHIVVFRIVGAHANVPLWVHEGIAKLESRDWDDLDARVVAEAVIRGNLLPLAQISETFPADQEALAYAQSAAFFRYFVRTFGRQPLRQVLAETARMGSFEKAMQSVTGLDVEAVEKQWAASMRKEYAPYLWMRFAGTAALGTLPILAILAYIAVRRHKRMLMERYEQEDLEEANRRDWGNSWPGGGLQ